MFGVTELQSRGRGVGRSVKAAASSSAAWPSAADFEDVSGISSKDSHSRDCASWLLI